MAAISNTQFSCHRRHRATAKICQDLPSCQVYGLGWQHHTAVPHGHRPPHRLRGLGTRVEQQPDRLTASNLRRMLDCYLFIPIHTYSTLFHHVNPLWIDRLSCKRHAFSQDRTKSRLATCAHVESPLTWAKRKKTRACAANSNAVEGSSSKPSNIFECSDTTSHKIQSIFGMCLSQT